MLDKQRSALFLDRDGVINKDLNYVYRVQDFYFIEDIFELCRAAQISGMALVVVTNQSGIARGYYSEEEFHCLTKWMRNEFRSNGVVLDKVYFCPYHPVHGIGSYRLDSQDRKPNPGMILRAKQELSLNLVNSILVGDSETDILAGKRAGVGKKILFRASGATKNSEADFIVSSHKEIISLCFSGLSSQSGMEKDV